MGDFSIPARCSKIQFVAEFLVLLHKKCTFAAVTSTEIVLSNNALRNFEAYGLPAGPTTLDHPTNEDLFVGTPARAVTS